MSSKSKRRQSASVESTEPVVTDNLPESTPTVEEQALPYDSLNGLDLARSEESENQLRNTLQNTAIVKDVIASEDEGVVLLVLGESDLEDAMVKISPTLFAAGWKVTSWSSREGFSRITVEKVEEVKGWWDGQNFRGDRPEVMFEDIAPFIPEKGKVDITKIATAAGCSFLHVDKLLMHAEIDGLRKIDRMWWIGEPQPQVEEKPAAVASVVDPAALAAVQELQAAIATLSPEAKAKAIEMGLIAGAKRGSVKSTDATKSRPAKPTKEVHECACGCGGTTKSAFCMGHDARAKGRLQRAMNGKLLQDEIDWRPNANLITYVRTHPEWDTKFGAWLTDYEHSVEELGGENEVILGNDETAAE